MEVVSESRGNEESLTVEQRQQEDEIEDNQQNSETIPSEADASQEDEQEEVVESSPEKESVDFDPFAEAQRIAAIIKADCMRSLEQAKLN